MEIVGYGFALGIGILLGAMGGGGAILTVPVLVYLMGISPEIATFLSLFVVGISALTGGLPYLSQKLVNYKSLLFYGIPSLVMVVFMRRFILPQVPSTVVVGSFEMHRSTLFMWAFAMLLLVIGFKMLNAKPALNIVFNPIRLIFSGLLEGVLSGMLGAGGGFLIVPALVMYNKMPIKMAVGTSLFIISIKSLIGFASDPQLNQTPWSLLLIFTGIAMVGSLVGNRISKQVDANRLKMYFAYFLVVMAFIIPILESIKQM